MSKEIQKGQIEGLVISPKTIGLFVNFGEIRNSADEVVKMDLLLGVFNNTMREIALKKGLTGFFKASIQSMSGNSWQTFSDKELSSLGEFVDTIEPRSSFLSSLSLVTKESHEAFCYPGGGDTNQDNVTNFAYVVNPYAQQSARIAFTLGEFYKMTPQNETVWFCSDDMSGGEKRDQLLKECLMVSMKKINTDMKKVDRVRSFLQAPADVWKKVFGNGQAA